MSEPLVSVILTTKNEEKDILKVLESINEQTYQNYELIVVDASSTDSTVELCKPYASRILNQPDRGYCAIGEAKNMAYERARGDYLAFTAAGCTWDSNFLMKSVEAMESKPAVPVIFTAWLLVDPTDTNIGRPYTSWEPERNALENYVLNESIDVQSMLVRRDKMIPWMPKGRNDDANFLMRFLHKHPNPMVSDIMGNTYDRRSEIFWTMGAYANYSYRNEESYTNAVLIKLHTLYELPYSLRPLYYKYFKMITDINPEEVKDLLMNLNAKCFAQFLEEVRLGKTLSDLNYYVKEDAKTGI